MSTTTIKVTTETKQLLDMLQARMTLTMRRKKTLTELIDAITRLAMRHEDELLEAEKLSPASKPAGERRTRAGKVNEYISTEE